MLNKYGAHGNTVQYEVYLCTGHSDDKPQWGCRIWVNGQPKGISSNKSNKQEAREEAASAAVMSLLLI